MKWFAVGARIFVFISWGGQAFATDEQHRTENQLSIGSWRSFPILKMGQSLKSSTTVSPVVGYHYLFDENWLLGSRLGFMRFDPLAPETVPTHILTFRFDTTYLLRVYHPLYLGVGGGLAYLFPSREATLPLEKHPDYPFEIGAQLHMLLTWSLPKQSRWSLEVSRLRGTGSYNIHADVVALSYSFAI
jgi:hypothetical protein